MTQEDTSQKIGTGMWMVAWLLLMGGLFLFFDDLINKKYNPNQNLVSQGNEVVLKRNRHGHYVATGAINGHPVTFLVDTGATSISIPEDVATRMGLTSGYPQRVSTANGDITVYGLTLDTVSLGGITLRDIRGHINPHMDGETALLGMSFMQYLEITQKDRTLTLKH